ncbi:MAG TPA: hypothetical protein P5567_08085 [Kiritimatiellia bacterium]|nr:hypothetical protein [Kiritimatiellia bacterium]HRZ12399.1 hypothetical protein [Kiritimatiellia bacterium]HSA17843.1 hypothetical protein [Kiritimatiellia bacterium]
MKKTILSAIVILVGLLSGGVRAGGPVTVASVDLNRIQNDVGNQRLMWLDMGEEARAEILNLRRSQDRLMVQCLKEDDDSKQAVLQTQLQSINNKLNMLRSALGNRGNDPRKALTRYIARRYGETYALVYDAQVERNNWSLIVWSASSVPDLTEEIIQTLDRELP